MPSEPAAPAPVAAEPVASAVTGWVPAPPTDAGVVPGPSAHDPPLSSQATEIRQRALASAVTAYSAAHGHPLDHPDPGVTTAVVRWATRGRVALAAALVLVGVTGVVVVRALDTVPSVVVAAGSVTTDAGGEPVALGATTTATEVGAAEVSADVVVVVHVVGQVVGPGIVTLPAGSRVADAIEAAGGAGQEADLAALNLARVLTDGEQVVVPRPGEQVQVVPGAGDAEGGLLDLNGADVAALDALPGIGPVLAQRIVDWRADNGRFTSVEELGEVTGIGPSVLADLRDRVRV